MVAFDFFTVPTANPRVLYCFFVIEHAHRKTLHFNITQAPIGGLGCTTTTGCVFGSRLLSLCDLGSRREVR
jgi:hypothetical protein